MRTIFLILSLSLFVLSTAQNTEISHKKFGLTFTPVGDNDVVRFDDLVGSGSAYGEGFFSVGLSYQNAIVKDWLKFETGLEYSHQKIRTEAAPNPPFTKAPSYSDFSLITIPANFKAEFLSILFIEGGGIIDLYSGPDARISNQNGLGLHLGYGLQYEIKSGWVFSVNHYARIHSLIAFTGDDYQQHMLENGLRVGIYLPFSFLKK